jgi:hypothetical protein
MRAFSATITRRCFFVLDHRQADGALGQPTNGGGLGLVDNFPIFPACRCVGMACGAAAIMGVVQGDAVEPDLKPGFGAQTAGFGRQVGADVLGQISGFKICSPQPPTQPENSVAMPYQQRPTGCAIASEDSRAQCLTQLGHERCIRHHTK